MAFTEDLTVFFDTAGAFLASVTVGALPDMVTFTPDGTKVVIANEGEPSADYLVDPEGSISIIDVTGKAITQADVTTLGFNGLAAGVIDASIRAFGPGSPTIGQDLEPEYVAVAPDSATAWVSLQEHSAVAVVDLATSSITSVRALGTKKHGQGTPSLTTATFAAPPVLGTTAAGQDILLGGFSGLWLDSIDAATGVVTLWANTDRGPNLEPVNVDGDAALERPFALPGFQPRIQRPQHGGGLFAGIFIANHRKPIAPAQHMHAHLMFDLRQIAVEFAA
jgi:DNA-binding beta-propeller fold protein YncE